MNSRFCLSNCLSFIGFGHPINFRTCRSISVNEDGEGRGLEHRSVRYGRHDDDGLLHLNHTKMDVTWRERRRAASATLHVEDGEGA